MVIKAGTKAVSAIDRLEAHVTVLPKTRAVQPAVLITLRALSAGPAAKKVQTIDVNRTQSNHSGFNPTKRNYIETLFTVPEGFEISGSPELRIDSLNHANPPQISVDGREVKIIYSLTSGPVIDQWRGWISGQLIVRLQSKGSSDTTILNPEMLVDDRRPLSLRQVDR